MKSLVVVLEPNTTHPNWAGVYELKYTDGNVMDPDLVKINQISFKGHSMNLAIELEKHGYRRDDVISVIVPNRAKYTRLGKPPLVRSLNASGFSVSLA